MYRRKVKGGSTTQIKIMNEDGTVTELTNKDDNNNNTVAEGNKR